MTWLARNSSSRFVVFVREGGRLLSITHLPTEQALVDFMRDKVVKMGIRSGVSLLSKGVEREVVFEEYEFMGVKNVHWGVKE